MKKVIFYNVLFVCVIIICVELYFGNWIFEDKINHLHILRNYDAQLDIRDLYKNREKAFIHYKRDKYGFRGQYKSTALIDILTVGGSTTDQRAIGEGSTWQDLMVKYYEKDGISLSVVNAGIDGQSTVGHILNFDLWFKKIQELHPKYILFYIGINDFYIDRSIQMEGYTDRSSLIQKIKFKSFFYYLFETIRGMWKVYGQETLLGHQAIDFETIKWTKGPPLQRNHENLMAGRLEKYEKRLMLLCEKSREFGSIPIFVTQYVKSKKREKGELIYLAKTIKYDGYKINGVDVSKMVDLLNQRTMTVCKKQNAVCLDLASDMEFGKDDFYDYVHPSDKGTRKIAEYLKQRLSPYIKKSGIKSRM
jgi:lysophospholipase L1-like esterase